jgi:hypothetical protein
VNQSNFYTDVIQKDPRFESPLPCRDTALLEPGFRRQVAAVISDAATMGIKLITTETFRSAAHQQALFASGRTSPGPILTKLDGRTPQTIGVHHFGLACDFARIEGGKTDWATADWLFLGPLATKYGLTWGGDWGTPSNLHKPGEFHDWDHLQACALAEQHAVFAGIWYPAESA